MYKEASNEKNQENRLPKMDILILNIFSEFSKTKN